MVKVEHSGDHQIHIIAEAIDPPRACEKHLESVDETLGTHIGRLALRVGVSEMAMGW